MRVAQLGLTPLKGGTHLHPDAVHVDVTGPRHDRVFCLVDLGARRVLRTVENSALLAVRSSFDGRRLRVEVPGAPPVEGDVDGAGTTVQADYWERRVTLRTVPGPWSAVLAERVGRDVALARSARPGGVVYDGAVTVVTTSSAREVATRRRSGLLDESALLADAERWRANVVVDTGDAEPFVEDAWVGREVALGDVVVRVRYGVPRCAVTRFRPGDGAPEAADPLAALAPDRRQGGALLFGLDAEVVTPGLVAVGDAVRIGDALSVR